MPGYLDIRAANTVFADAAAFTDGRGIVWGWALEDFQMRLGELYNKRIAFGTQALSLPKLLNGIRKALDGKCVGYGVVISSRGNLEFRYLIHL